MLIFMFNMLRKFIFLKKENITPIPRSEFGLKKFELLSLSGQKDFWNFSLLYPNCCETLWPIVFVIHLEHNIEIEQKKSAKYCQNK